MGSTHNKFNKIFKHHNITIMPQNKYSIKNLLNSNMKAYIPPENKSGIHQINCKDCEKINIYIYIYIYIYTDRRAKYI